MLLKIVLVFYTAYNLFMFPSAVDSVAVRLDNCTFHESVDLSNFEATQTLVVSPPEGEVRN